MCRHISLLALSDGGNENRLRDGTITVYLCKRIVTSKQRVRGIISCPLIGATVAKPGNGEIRVDDDARRTDTPQI
jgi:hypothetical protein